MELQRKKKSVIFGICGGYQMLGEEIRDPHAIESPHQVTDGLCLLPIRSTITNEKTTVLSNGVLVLYGKSFSVTGYEIHMGETETTGDFQGLIKTNGRTDGCKTEDDSVIGTYFHGIFHNDPFREELLNQIRKTKGLAPINNRVSFNQLREDAFDRLADHVRGNVNLDFIEDKMKEFQKRRMT
jgi:adenosylcobyric acid synthase